MKKLLTVFFLIVYCTDICISGTSKAVAQSTTEPTRRDSYALFAPIIEAYVELEQSGFCLFDEDLIGDSLLAIGKGSTYNFGWDHRPTLMYAFHDINLDGSPELLIGGVSGAEIQISGIYTMQNGSPVSVLQVESRHSLYLLMGSDGNCVIEHAWGHMDYATEFFYTLDNNGALVTLDRLYTTGNNIHDGKRFGHLRAKEVGGATVRITENEYSALLQKYGSWGYQSAEGTEGENLVSLSWEPVSADVYLYTKGFNNDSRVQAEMLSKLGLFMGTERGFELDRSMTRAEAAVMLVRFLGAEDKALARAWTHPFSDVPTWADNYIGWLYQNGLTNGVSPVEYGSVQNVTFKQYAQFLARALLGSDIPEDGWKYCANEGECTRWDEDIKIFTRATAVGLSVRALTLVCHTGAIPSSSMTQVLIDSGVFTAEQLGEAAFNVLPSAYGTVAEGEAFYLTRYVALVPVARCPENGLTLVSSPDSGTPSYLLAMRKTEDGIMEFFILDPKTLKVLASDDYSPLDG